MPTPTFTTLPTFEQLFDVSLIQSLDGLNRDLDAIKRDVQNGKNSGYCFYDLDGVEKARIASTIVHSLIHSVLNGSKHKKGYSYYDKNGFGHIITEQVIIFDNSGKNICDYLEQVVTSSVLNSSEISRFDNMGERIVEGLFKAYYLNPLILPKSVLRRMAFIEKCHQCPGSIDLSNSNSKVAQEEIKRIHNSYLPWRENLLENSNKIIGQDKEYEIKKMLLVRTIVDYIAGMTDSFALKEYKDLCESGV